MPTKMIGGICVYGNDKTGMISPLEDSKMIDKLNCNSRKLMSDHISLLVMHRFPGNSLDFSWTCIRTGEF